MGAYVAGALNADVRALSEELGGTRDHARAVERTTALFLRWLGGRELLVAKLELTMEATRDAELAEVFATWRGELVEVVDGILDAAGHEHSRARSATLVAALDGVLMGALTQGDAVRRGDVEASVAMLLEATTGA